MEICIDHVPESLVFVATVDDTNAGRLAYSNREQDQEWVAYTTHVDPQFEGNGVGSALSLALAQAAKAAGVTVNPTCWFVAGWFDRHPEYSNLVAS